MTNNSIPTFFSVSRAVQYSDGLLTAIKSDGSDVAISIRELAQRGSKSSHGDAYKLARGDAKITKDINSPNPQVVDGAFLPFDSSRLRLSFSMNVLSTSVERQACNDFMYTEKVREFFSAFNSNSGFVEIAKLLVWRIASASALWRNHYGVDKTVCIKVIGNPDQSWTFEADKVSTETPDGFSPPEDLTNLVAAALSGTSPVLMLSIVCEVTIGFGQELFPSQELEMKKERNSKSKVLYSIPYKDGNTAAMHPQKIGAAIRAFDIWHPEFAKAGPLSIEPLGYSHQHQRSFRTVDTGTDLYAYLQNIDSMTKELREGTLSNHAIFLAACFMRGGVFSASTDEEEKKRKAEEKKQKAVDKKQKPAKGGDEPGQVADLLSQGLDTN